MQNIILQFLLVGWIGISCNHVVEAQSWNEIQGKLVDYENLATTEVMVLGTHHFNKEVLEDVNQLAIIKIVDQLIAFKPDKIILEWEPSRSVEANRQYYSYLQDSFSIVGKYNEVYQLGFRVARALNHDQLYFFDNQTEFIGSLENFSWDHFNDYATKNDAGFYDKFLDTIIHHYERNEALFKSLTLDQEIIMRNSPKAQQANAHRMHIYEVRVGIQDTWIGPDWLGRWYQRNVRMLANLIKMNEPQERFLIIVGDNHKWILDQLIEFTPEFKPVSSWEFLTKN